MSAARQITKADLISNDEYGRQRAERRKSLVAMKKARRIEVGPYATFYFENYETMWHQIQEMLFIEKGGDEQIEDELAAYNPLIPQGQDLSCTLMFEIADPDRRLALLRRLTNVELSAFIEVDGEKVMAEPEQDVERTAPDGKTSSVHFLHFRFSPAQIAKFKDPAANVVIGFTHENYAHMTLMQPEARTSLAEDFA